MGNGSSAPTVGVFTCDPVGPTHNDTVSFDLAPSSLSAADLRNVRVTAISCWESEFVHGLQFHYSFEGAQIEATTSASEFGLQASESTDLKRAAVTGDQR